MIYRLPMLALLLGAILIAGPGAGAASLASMGNLRKRTCDRIVARFAQSPQAHARVNERIRKRYGFACAGASAVLRGSDSSPRPIMYDPTAVQCTERKWQCDAWSSCFAGSQHRKCEIDYHVDTDCLNPEAAQPAESQACTDYPDPAVGTFVSAYDTFSQGLDTMLEIAKGHSASTWLVLKDIVEGYQNNLRLFSQYVDLARMRPLITEEQLLANELMARMNQAMGWFQNAIENENAYTPPTQIFIVPVEPEMSPEDHERMCINLRMEVAMKGFGSLNAQRQLFEAGCESLKQYCQSPYNISDPRCK